ncbi:prophage CP4-57 regulatory family protein [Burkholderia pseudomallei]|uniref:helix-turn-helix transcriptional regulator n=1 Tax=Burkholderia pseudomallei TaxID=28450 RepID=UPI0005391A56|nr:AlpA family phage regulatory protein [Burkholderia pseudomallei]KGX22223.1 prophage CP4-57 regulatory family protein [Burkholderia pseudomallei]KGX28861.1 prophage CP4-57 regulatory family protein [Burkholderia pseudomallei]
MLNQASETALRWDNPVVGDASGEAQSLGAQVKRALRILRMKQLIERTNLSRATLYVLMSSDPTFPRKIKLTARSIGFLESDVDAWITRRAEITVAVR